MTRIAHKPPDYNAGAFTQEYLAELRTENVRLRNAVQAALDFYEWHMNAVPSAVLEELTNRRIALQRQLRDALDGVEVE